MPASVFFSTGKVRMILPHSIYSTTPGKAQPPEHLTFGEKFGQGVVELGGILFGGGRSHGRGSAFGADGEIHGRDL
jgi:hypothetical protein